MLDVPFTLLSSEYVIVPFGVDEAVQAVSLREAVRDSLPMLPGPPSKVGRGPDIDRTFGRLVMM
jgi:hypothetical protein